MSIKPNPNANLGPRRPTQSRVAESFTSVSAKQSKLTARIDEDLHHRFKVTTTKKNLTMGGVLEDLIAEWLRQNED